ncbi:MAG: SGNH/GDSL hydrolase family protein [Bacteroidota bacterium]
MKRINILFVMLSFLLSNKKFHAQDWPNLSKYQEANATLQARASNEQRVVFMGNSITEGWKTTNPSFFANPAYINRGIGGQTTPQMLLRFRQDVIDLQPKIVVILAGTNDIAGNTGPITLEQIRDNILSMVELAKANAIIPVICSVLPAYDYPWSPGKSPNANIPKLNTLLKGMATEQKVPFLDYFSEMADDRNGLPPAYTTDEVHLTKEGYAVMEKLVAATLSEIQTN